MRSKNLNFVLINLFFVAVVIFYIFALWQGTLVKSFFLVAFFVLLLFVFTLWHAVAELKAGRAIIFLVLAGLISFFAEVIGVNFSYDFGRYAYSDLLGPKILGVPILVSLMWMAIIYIAYQVSEHITNFRFTNRTHFLQRFWLSFWSALLTALAIVSWDLALDPLARDLGWWAWLEKGDYFGVPLGNFIGWMVISFVVVFIYKLFFEKEALEKDTFFEYAPLVSYTLLCFLTILMALNLGQPVLAFVAFSGMFPFISIMIIRFLVLQLKFPEQFRK